MKQALFIAALIILLYLLTRPGAMGYSRLRSINQTGTAQNGGWLDIGGGKTYGSVNTDTIAGTHLDVNQYAPIS